MLISPEARTMQMNSLTELEAAFDELRGMLTELGEEVEEVAA